MKTKRTGLMGQPKFNHNSVRARFAAAMQQGASTKAATAFANGVECVKRTLTQLQPPPGNLPKAKQAKAAKKKAAKKKTAKKKAVTTTPALASS